MRTTFAASEDCGACGFPVPVENARYCPWCGNRVESVSNPECDEELWKSYAYLKAERIGKGKSIPEIAEDLPVTGETVRLWLHRFDLMRPEDDHRSKGAAELNAADPEQIFADGGQPVQSTADQGGDSQ